MASPPAPEFILLRASAGSGKTYELARRYLKLALAPADDPAWGGLAGILAITFTKNAAGEMKDRILGWLKEAAFGDARRVAELREVIPIPEADFPAQAGRAVDRILAEYADFQVETIDGFMTSVFKASALDLGFPPDFEVQLEHAELIDYAFFRHLRGVRPGSPDAAVFDLILDHLLLFKGDEASFPWNPTADILGKLTEMYGKLTERPGEPRIEDRSRALASCAAGLKAAAARLEDAVEASGLERSARGHAFSRILPAIREGRLGDLIGASFKTPPVKKGRVKKADRARVEAAVEAVSEAWEGLGAVVRSYVGLYARDFFTPYLRAYRALSGTLDRVKRSQGVVFLEDMYRQLSGYIQAGLVPDIYFRLGERVRHFLIDEFQDTSPMQWLNLRPLVEESLSQGGSLLVVGDTKQAIYGFREADFRIMRALETGEDRFGPVPNPEIRNLDKNYRSGEALIRFVQGIFRRLPEEYESAAKLSGLSDFLQDPSQGNAGAGYVEYVLLDASPERGEEGEGESGKTIAPAEREANRADGEAERKEAGGGDGESAGEAEAEAEGNGAPPEAGPEKARLQELVSELHDRGYAYSDIAVLTYKNESVASAASWLNEIGVPFIPFSSLDIRRRGIIGEVLAVLRFLDSPPDNLAFASVILGQAFGRAAGEAPSPEALRRFIFECRAFGRSPLYAAFRERYPELWGRIFEPLFQAVGYYPLYDLAVSVYRAFDLFGAFPGEEAALVRFLEAIKGFEGRGRNDLREFLEYTGSEGREAWTIDVPESIDAVKVMTIHKAKGLGFPVTILLLYGEGWKPPDFFLDDGSEAASGDGGGFDGGEGPAVLKINKDITAEDADLKRIYDEVRLRDRVNSLNTLYVALTRAGSELYIVGVRKPGDKYPFEVMGEPFRSASAKPPARRPSLDPAGRDAPLRRIESRLDVPAASGEGLGEESRRRGEFAHRIMAEIEYVPEGDWPAQAALAASQVDPRFRSGEKDAASPDADSAGLTEAIARFFARPPASGFFQPRPGRRVLRETTFCDAAGRSVRMDRVVVDPDAVTVIDYKTGREPGLGDRDQVLAYLAIVRDVFAGRPARGALAYIDREVWETVE
jgi:ATP-dependent exoDNAse (exonuclease V) beta subunit